MQVLEFAQPLSFLCLCLVCWHLAKATTSYRKNKDQKFLKIIFFKHKKNNSLGKFKLVPLTFLYFVKKNSFSLHKTQATQYIRMWEIFALAKECLLNLFLDIK